MAPYTQCSCLEILWTESLVTTVRKWLEVGFGDFTLTFRFRTLEKMAQPAQCSCLENQGPGSRLQISGKRSHRSDRDWNDLAAATNMAQLTTVAWVMGDCRFSPWRRSVEKHGNPCVLTWRNLHGCVELPGKLLVSMNSRKSQTWLWMAFSNFNTVLFKQKSWEFGKVRPNKAGGAPVCLDCKLLINIASEAEVKQVVGPCCPHVIVNRD